MRHAAYLHIPFCRRRCFYCDFPISVVGDRARGETSHSMANYVEQICAEIAATPKDPKPLSTVFFGGGTPSLLSPQQVARLLETLDQSIGLTTGAEISMEMDPGTFTEAQLQALIQSGVNRVSLGVQAFQDELLERCGRSHNLQDILNAIQILTNLGLNNWSLDLISGLPGQTLTHWEHSLQQALKLQPRHISCYDLVLEPPTVFGKREKRGLLTLPDEDHSAQMYRQASAVLREAGYLHYEISNYAQPGYQCRHNLTYWRNQDFYGFGMGAASYHQGRRITRPKTRAGYFDWVAQLQQSTSLLQDGSPLDVSDRLFETLMVGLRLSEGIDLTALSLQFGKKVTSVILRFIEDYAKPDWISVETNSITQKLTLRLSDPDGFLYSNQILVSLWNALDAA